MWLVIREPGFTGGEHPALLGTNGLSAGAVCPLKNNSPPSGSLYGLHTATACSRFCLGISAAWSAVADRRCIILPGSGWFLELFCFFLSFFLGMEPDLSTISQPAKASPFT